MPEIKLIAMDLDDTLLTTDKRITEDNLNAMREASDKGIWIVPTTGRLASTIPQQLRDEAFLRYIILMNGGQIYDMKEQKKLYETTMPWEQAVELMKYLDEYDCIYDAYIGDQGWMTEALQNRADEFTEDPYYRWAIKNVRRPVPELKAYTAERKEGVQKMQMFVKDLDFRRHLLDHMSDMFPGLYASSAIFNNVEINNTEANKGDALKKLSEYLGFGIENVMAIGDGYNDISMIKAAGTGVCMENGYPEVREAADFITLDNNHSGVGYAIRRFCL